jgi:hypothetical protein
MKKIINKGLNQFGVQMMNERYEGNRQQSEHFNRTFKLGDRIGKVSKTLLRTKQLDTNPNSITMGYYNVTSCTHGDVSIPLEWLNYEIQVFEMVK